MFANSSHINEVSRTHFLWPEKAPWTEFALPHRLRLPLPCVEFPPLRSTQRTTTSTTSGLNGNNPLSYIAWEKALSNIPSMKHEAALFTVVRAEQTKRLAENSLLFHRGAEKEQRL